jgi:hypothetical protein
VSPGTENLRDSVAASAASLRRVAAEWTDDRLGWLFEAFSADRWSLPAIVEFLAVRAGQVVPAQDVADAFMPGPTPRKRVEQLAGQLAQLTDRAKSQGIRSIRPDGLEVWPFISLRTTPQRYMMPAAVAERVQRLRGIVGPEVGANGTVDGTDEVAAATNAIALLAGEPGQIQGLRLDAAARRAIERVAMEIAIDYYAGDGWHVGNVSSHRPYDLLCTRPNGAELHVEVKGTASAGEKVLLTPNEVRHAREHFPNVALFVVANLIPTSSSDPAARPLRILVFEPWQVDAGALIPVGFQYALPASPTLDYVDSD